MNKKIALILYGGFRLLGWTLLVWGDVITGRRDIVIIASCFVGSTPIWPLFSWIGWLARFVVAFIAVWIFLSFLKIGALSRIVWFCLGLVLDAWITKKQIIKWTEKQGQNFESLLFW